MLELALEDPVGAAPLLAGGLLDPDEVADAVVAGIAEERFLILPHGRSPSTSPSRALSRNGGSRGCAVCCARPATSRRRPEQVNQGFCAAARRS